MGLPKVSSDRAKAASIRRVKDAVLKFMGQETKSESRLVTALKEARHTFQITGSKTALRKAEKLATRLMKYGGGAVTAGLILATDLAKPAGATPSEERDEISRYKKVQGEKTRSKALKMLK